MWMIPNGDAPGYVKNHPAMKGVDMSKMGKPERSPLLVTKTLLFGADGAGLFYVRAGGGRKFRAINKKTGEVIHEMALPANVTGLPNDVHDQRQAVHRCGRGSGGISRGTAGAFGAVGRLSSDRNRSLAPARCRLPAPASSASYSTPEAH